MLESPASGAVATVDDTGMPHASRAWGLWVLGGGTRLRFLLPAHDARSATNIAANGRVAYAATEVESLRSLQVKCTGAVVTGPATGDDRLLHERYTDAFLQVVHENDGLDLVALRNLVPGALVAVECDVVSLFDATPGPSAGTSLS